MTLDRKKFFDVVRKELFKGTLAQSQVEGISFILDVWEQKYTDKVTLPYLAYALGTTHHETDKTMLPINEYGKGRGRSYGKPHPKTKQTYFGRGYVQLTWYDNYLKAENKLGQPFTTKPELALDPKLAAEIMFTGMLEGWFTGKKFSSYISTGNYTQFREARRIINGMDKASLISEYAADYLSALNAGMIKED